MNKYLFIGAHPDDVEINAGGYISKLVDEGENVMILICTCSEAVSDRKLETLKSMTHLFRHPLENCYDLMNKKVFFESFQDGKLYLSKFELIQAIETLIKSKNITHVVTHYPYDTHQDHAIVGEATLAAARNVGNIMFYRPTYPSGRPVIPFNPTYFVTLTEEQMDRKLVSLGCHKSQALKYGDDLWIQSVKQSSAGDSWVYVGKHGYCELFQAHRITH